MTMAGLQKKSFPGWVFLFASAQHLHCRTSTELEGGIFSMETALDFLMVGFSLGKIPQWHFPGIFGIHGTLVQIPGMIGNTMENHPLP